MAHIGCYLWVSLHVWTSGVAGRMKGKGAEQGGGKKGGILETPDPSMQEPAPTPHPRHQAQMGDTDLSPGHWAPALPGQTDQAEAASWLSGCPLVPTCRYSSASHCALFSFKASPLPPKK